VLEVSRALRASPLIVPIFVAAHRFAKIPLLTVPVPVQVLALPQTMR
jgi:hypothetical protein